MSFVVEQRLISEVSADVESEDSSSAASGVFGYPSEPAIPPAGPPQVQMAPPQPFLAQGPRPCRRERDVARFPMQYRRVL